MILVQNTALWVLVIIMADRSLSTEGNRESKLYKPSNTRPRLGSDSSYVVLRETAKCKQGGQKSTKRQERSTKRNRSGRPHPNHSHNKNGCCSRLCIHRLLQFLVLFFSVCALTLVILMILGILGPERCPACKNLGKVNVIVLWNNFAWPAIMLSPHDTPWGLTSPFNGDLFIAVRLRNRNCYYLLYAKL